jgi:release factor glutamine methyltransferase
LYFRCSYRTVISCLDTEAILQSIMQHTHEPPPPRNPNVASIKRTAFKPDVYEPAEDSFLLADVVLAESASWDTVPRICVEIGSGSGYVVCSVAASLKHERQSGCHCIATDINPVACAATRETVVNHGVGNIVDVVNCDLLAPLLPRLQGKVDLVVFNPPYVVTPDEEVVRGGIAAAWAGGYRGRVVIDRVLDILEGLLAEGGRVYMIAIHENEPEEILERMRGQGLEAAMVATQVADEEVLHVLRFRKP